MCLFGPRHLYEPCFCLDIQIQYLNPHLKVTAEVVEAIPQILNVSIPVEDWPVCWQQFTMMVSLLCGSYDAYFEGKFSTKSNNYIVCITLIQIPSTVILVHKHNAKL